LGAKIIYNKKHGLRYFRAVFFIFLLNCYGVVVTVENAAAAAVVGANTEVVSSRIFYIPGVAALKIGRRDIDCLIPGI
jgi:uncharacterized ferredoxin-like protein